VAGVGPGAAGQSLIGQSRSISGLDEFGDTAGQPSGKEAHPLSWARYVIGLDQAIETIRNEADERLKHEAKPAAPKEPGTTQLEPENSARPTDTTTFRGESGLGRNRGSLGEADQVEAVDVALSTWGRQEPAWMQSLLPETQGAANTESSPPLSRFEDVIGRASFLRSLNEGYSGLVDKPGSRLAALVAVATLTAAARQTLVQRVRSSAVPGSSPTPRSTWASGKRRGPRG
jgi:hypothetical protein